MTLDLGLKPLYQIDDEAERGRLEAGRAFRSAGLRPAGPQASSRLFCAKWAGPRPANQPALQSALQCRNIGRPITFAIFGR